MCKGVFDLEYSIFKNNNHDSLIFAVPERYEVNLWTNLIIKGERGEFRKKNHKTSY